MYRDTAIELSGVLLSYRDRCYTPKTRTTIRPSRHLCVPQAVDATTHDLRIVVPKDPSCETFDMPVTSVGTLNYATMIISWHKTASVCFNHAPYSSKTQN